MDIFDRLFDTGAHKGALFDRADIAALAQRIEMRNGRGGDVPYIECLVRKKRIKLTPEEAVRQLYIHTLMKTYGYTAEDMRVEHPIHFGREVKRADIVLIEREHPETPYIIIEVKKPKLSEGKEQLKSYCNATGATMGVWTNGQQISYYHRKDPNYFEDIPNIPRAGKKLKDILTERWTIDNLVQKDKLVSEKKSLKGLIEEMEDEVLANAGVDVFEEVFKLIYTKLYDEMESGRDRTRTLEFRNYGDTDVDLKASIQNLFERAKERWPGVFPSDAAITLTPSHLAVCVSSLQDVKLFNSNLDVVDDAFEYLMNKSQKGEKGQYFTPRYVIDMCVRMLNPGKDETMIDPAAGSCGFPVHTIFYVWKKILAEKGIHQSHLFTAEKKPPACEDYVRKNVFAIDFDEKAVRVARTLNLIAGDGRTNVLHLNTLDYEQWNSVTSEESWRDAYHEGWKGLRALRAVKGENRDFAFDIVMANPPFAGDIKESRMIAKYDLGKTAKGKYQNKVGRDILFIERNLSFLKPGGRMAIVLPQGRFNNVSDQYIRDYIAARCRILAVVGLHGNVFKPHTGTKTSVLFVQKWDEVLCPRRDDYPIFFATMQRPSKDSSGDKIVRTDAAGQIILDSHGHMIVDHDLFNHDGMTEDGIAEAFAAFARRRGTKFFSLSPSTAFNEAQYRALMDGLECSEIMLSALEHSVRMDAEYYSKRNLLLQERLNAVGAHPLSAYGATLDCSAFYPSIAGAYSHDRSKIPFLRVDEIQEGLVRITDNTVFLPEELLQKNSKTIARAYPRDIIIAKGGNTLAKVGLVTDEFPYYAVCRDVIVLRTDRLDGLNPYFLWAFLHSSHGQGILWRSASQTGQPHLTLPAILEIKIPDAGSLASHIEKCYKKSAALQQQSDDLFASARDILRSALKFDRGNISVENTTEKSFSAIAAAGRLDAEYYQPKYDTLLNLLNTDETVGSLCHLHDSNFSPAPHTEYAYIELANVGRCNAISKVEVMEGRHLPSRAKRQVRAGQVIVSSIEGSLQSCALIPEEYEGALCSNGFHVLDSDAMNPETLLLLFQSEPIQELMRQRCSGTILTAISKGELLRMPLPLLPPVIQQKIATHVQESSALRRRAKQNLDRAVRAVEIAIEQDEAAALSFLHARA